MEILNLNLFREPNSFQNIPNGYLSFMLPWGEAFSSFIFSSCPFGGGGGTPRHHLEGRGASISYNFATTFTTIGERAGSVGQYFLR